MKHNCPPWCVADHSAEDEPGSVRHRGSTYDAPVVLRPPDGSGPTAGEILVELSREHDEAAVWLYLGDGWTGFSLSLESAARVRDALGSALRDAGTLEATGL